MLVVAARLAYAWLSSMLVVAAHQARRERCDQRSSYPAGFFRLGVADHIDNVGFKTFTVRALRLSCAVPSVAALARSLCALWGVLAVLMLSRR